MEFKSLKELDEQLDRNNAQCIDCDTLLKDSKLFHYDHNGGVMLTEYPVKQWVYLRCKSCGYENALWKILDKIDRRKHVLEQSNGTCPKIFHTQMSWHETGIYSGDMEDFDEIWFVPDSIRNSSSSLHISDVERCKNREISLSSKQCLFCLKDVYGYFVKTSVIFSGRRFS